MILICLLSGRLKLTGLQPGRLHRVECASGASLIIPKYRTSTNWNDASSASGPLWVTRLLTVLLKSDISVYALAFMLEADILSTRWNKDCVIWHIQQWLFWETITVSHVCCYSVQRAIKESWRKSAWLWVHTTRSWNWQQHRQPEFVVAHGSYYWQ